MADFHGTERKFDDFIIEVIKMDYFKNLKIAVASTGYVGLSIATLLSQHHKVVAMDIVPEAEWYKEFYLS